MKRKIITVDEELCNGCGQCVTACSEGALEIVDGKARLVKESFCDGFGDCMGECPTGALKIEERETDEFDIKAVEEHLVSTKGSDAVERMRAAQQKHSGTAHGGGGCPGRMMRMRTEPSASQASAVSGSGAPEQVMKSDLTHWPVQLHLVNPGAPFFNNRELLVLSTCAPVASADAHWRFIRGRAVVVACPKLDNTEGYVDKLAGILENKSIPKVVIVRMEVPCCGGLTAIVKEAVEKSGRTDLEVEEVTVGLDGGVQA